MLSEPWTAILVHATCYNNRDMYHMPILFSFCKMFAFLDCPNWLIGSASHLSLKETHHAIVDLHYKLSSCSSAGTSDILMNTSHFFIHTPSPITNSNADNQAPFPMATSHASKHTPTLMTTSHANKDSSSLMITHLHTTHPTPGTNNHNNLITGIVLTIVILIGM